MNKRRAVKAVVISVFILIFTVVFLKIPPQITGASIRELSSSGENFCFAVVGDTHTNLMVFNKISGRVRKENVDFLIVNGDITDYGRENEYRFMHSSFTGIGVPVFTVAGNHDVLNNGDYLYKKFFGSLNYSFIHGNSKFVVIDSSSKKISSAQKAWLLSELSSSEENKFVVSHIPIAEFDTGLMQDFAELGVTAVIQSHVHLYSEDSIDGVKYYVTPSGGGILENDKDDFGFLKFCVNGEEIKVEKIDVSSTFSAFVNSVLPSKFIKPL